MTGPPGCPAIGTGYRPRPRPGWRGSHSSITPVAPPRTTTPITPPITSPIPGPRRPRPALGSSAAPADGPDPAPIPGSCTAGAGVVSVVATGAGADSIIGEATGSA